MGTTSMKYPLLCNNAEDFISYCVEKRHPELKPYVSSKPACGAIVVQEGKGALAGHVMIVEKIIDDNSLDITESCYGGTAFRHRTIKKTKAWDGTIGWGNNDHLKFINFIHNPAVIEKTEAEVTPGVPRDESVNQVYTTNNSLRVRETPSLKGTIIGFVTKNVYYNYTEIKKADGYVWYKIAESQWIADCGSIKVYKASEGLKKGDKVKITGKGNTRPNGSGSVCGGIGFTRYILADMGASYKYRYRVGSKTGVITGYYAASALQKL